MHLKIATNNNRLGIAQAEKVAGKLKELGHSYELIKVSNVGTSRIKSHFYGEETVLVKKLQETVKKGKADIAVYAMKDVIYNQNSIDKAVFPAVLKRESHREAVITREGEDFLTFKEGAKIGVSSTRKSTQIKKSFPYLDIEFITGNTDTKIEKLDSKKVDAIILAESDVKLLNMENRIGLVFESDVVMPAFGQGIIGVLCNEENQELISELKKINDVETQNCFEVEKAIVRSLNKKGQAPVAGYCEYSLGGSLRVVGLVASNNGDKVIRARRKEKDIEPKILGEKFAQDLMGQGADKL